MPARRMQSAEGISNRELKDSHVEADEKVTFIIGISNRELKAFERRTSATLRCLRASQIEN